MSEGVAFPEIIIPGSHGHFSIDNYSMFPQTDGELHMELHQSSLFPLLLADTTDRFKYKFYKSKYLKTFEATILVTESLI